MFQFLIHNNLLSDCLISIIESYLSPPHKITVVTRYDECLFPIFFDLPLTGRLYDQIMEMNKHIRFISLSQTVAFNADMWNEHYCVNCLNYISKYERKRKCQTGYHTYCVNCNLKFDNMTESKGIKQVNSDDCVGCWYSGFCGVML